MSMAGKEFEARLRQQHTKLNPKTSWARVDKKKAKKKKQAFGDESDEECVAHYIYLFTHPGMLACMFNVETDVGVLCCCQMLGQARRLVCTACHHLWNIVLQSCVCCGVGQDS